MSKLVYPSTYHNSVDTTSCIPSDDFVQIRLDDTVEDAHSALKGKAILFVCLFAFLSTHKFTLCPLKD